MQFTTILLSALTGAASISATPVPEKRTCQVQMPRSLGFPNNYNIYKSPQGSEVNNNIGFNIPPGAGGPCSLAYQFPVGFDLQQSGNPQVNVRALDGPAAGSIVGTTTFTADGAVHTINSFACAPDLSYELSIAGEEGSVAFQVTETGTGPFITYSC